MFLSDLNVYVVTVNADNLLRVFISRRIKYEIICFCFPVLLYLQGIKHLNGNCSQIFSEFIPCHTGGESNFNSERLWNFSNVVCETAIAFPILPYLMTHIANFCFIWPVAASDGLNNWCHDQIKFEFVLKCSHFKSLLFVLGSILSSLLSNYGLIFCWQERVRNGHYPYAGHFIPLRRYNAPFGRGRFRRL